MKNANSKRIIPIHQILLKLGFLDYVISRGNAKAACGRNQISVDA
jgi:hypothetical protein